jgi:hypothetical protein
MADWDLPALLLRRLDLHLAGANWQRGGGKSANRPKAISLPDDKGRGNRPAGGKASGADVADRLRALGMIPAEATTE